jgi:hypothetical protein
MVKQLLLLLAVILSGCAPQVLLDKPSVAQKYPPLQDFEPFVCIEQDTVALVNPEFLSDIEIKDNGMSVNCDYGTVKALAMQQAKSLGGNCLVITEHKVPNHLSTCHRIKGKVYRLAHPEQYETEIIWHQQRRLTVADFKGSIEKRPFLAATYSGFRYVTKVQPFTGRFQMIVMSYFDCNLSYFKAEPTDSVTLRHEQLHFNITEIYARKFVENMQREVKSLKDFQTKEKDILDAVWKELQLKQDEYDAAVYADRSKQPGWDLWVTAQLERSAAFAGKKLEISLK